MANARERLFFALMAPGPVQSTVAQLQGETLPGGGRWVGAENLHVTLLFLGSVEPGQRKCLIRGADTVRCEPFTLVFDAPGVWQRPQVAWLGSSGQIPEAMTGLATSIEKVAQDCGISGQDRPLVPHVTMARKIRALPAGLSRPFPPVAWPVNEFCLVRSETRSEGVIYRVIQRWTLSPNSA
ncbi:MAG: RNA 2',3'-cyclic phosphodiesterase [Gammaproteobacteria bacterium]|nr:RNA 2',3'-cyclic phosphodiesterase [Gammaproteobacteria bacterium]